jgi:peptide deformylase
MRPLVSIFTRAQRSIQHIHSIKIAKSLTLLRSFSNETVAEEEGIGAKLGRVGRRIRKFSVGQSLFGYGRSKPGRQERPKLRILKYPHPKLRQENLMVTEFNEDLHNTVNNLLSAMYASDGLGLAAPQVGINYQLIVFNESGTSDERDTEIVMCNPVIKSLSEETWVDTEGCLSFPRIHGKVRRPMSVDIEYQDIDGNSMEISFEKMSARIFLHEFDHLKGKLMIDRFSDRDKGLGLNKKRLDMLIERYGEGGAI